MDTEEKPKLITAHYAKVRQKKAVARVEGRGGGVGDYKNQKHMDILSFNAGAEDAFVLLVTGMIKKNDGKPVELGRVIQKASYKLNVSPMTAKRYLLKHTDDEAELQVFGKMVMMNPKFGLEEEDER